MDTDPAPLHLHRFDAARNMARFYALSLAPTLWGEVALVRRWGRIGTAGRQAIDTHPDAEAALAALHRLAGIKTRRGYTSV